MSEEYNCYQYAIKLGFTEAEARLLQASKVGMGQDATVLRRLATAKGLPSSKPNYPMPAVKLPILKKGKPPARKKRTTKRKPNKKG